MPAGGDPAVGSPDAEYLVEHVRSALATDPRVLQQGMDVSFAGEVVVVRGSVPTTSVRDGVAAVVGDVVPGMQVVNDVDVTPNTEPGANDVEDLA